jgi:hypothetical protein
MKQIYKAMAVSLLLIPIALTLQAEENPQQPPPPPPHNMHGGMEMHGDMMREMPSLEKLKEMQEHLLTMHDLSNKILAEKDPKKQQALKDQQLEIMKAHIADRMAKHQQKHKMPPPATAPSEKK